MAFMLYYIQNHTSTGIKTILQAGISKATLLPKRLCRLALALATVIY
jgi:hypothetical protein